MLLLLGLVFWLMAHGLTGLPSFLLAVPSSLPGLVWVGAGTVVVAGGVSLYSRLYLRVREIKDLRFLEARASSWTVAALFLAWLYFELYDKGVLVVR